MSHYATHTIDGFPIAHYVGKNSVAYFDLRTYPNRRVIEIRNTNAYNKNIIRLDLGSVGKHKLYSGDDLIVKYFIHYKRLCVRVKTEDPTVHIIFVSKTNLSAWEYKVITPHDKCMTFSYYSYINKPNNYGVMYYNDQEAVDTAHYLKNFYVKNSYESNNSSQFVYRVNEFDEFKSIRIGYQDEGRYYTIGYLKYHQDRYITSYFVRGYIFVFCYATDSDYEHKSAYINIDQVCLVYETSLDKDQIFRSQFYYKFPFYVNDHNTFEIYESNENELFVNEYVSGNVFHIDVGTQSYFQELNPDYAREYNTTKFDDNTVIPLKNDFAIILVELSKEIFTVHVYANNGAITRGILHTYPPWASVDDVRFVSYSNELYILNSAMDKVEKVGERTIVPVKDLSIIDSIKNDSENNQLAWTDTNEEIYFGKPMEIQSHELVMAPRFIARDTYKVNDYFETGQYEKDGALMYSNNLVSTSIVSAKFKDEIIIIIIGYATGGRKMRSYNAIVNTP